MLSRDRSGIADSQGDNSGLLQVSFLSGQRPVSPDPDMMESRRSFDDPRLVFPGDPPGFLLCQVVEKDHRPGFLLCRSEIHVAPPDILGPKKREGFFDAFRVERLEIPLNKRAVLPPDPEVETIDPEAIKNFEKIRMSVRESHFPLSSPSGGGGVVHLKNPSGQVVPSGVRPGMLGRFNSLAGLVFVNPSNPSGSILELLRARARVGNVFPKVPGHPGRMSARSATQRFPASTHGRM